MFPGKLFKPLFRTYLCKPKSDVMNILSDTPAMLLSMPGGSEWLIIVLVVIILFGGRKIPELARGLGKGIRDFKDAKDGMKQDIESGITKDPGQS